MLMCSLFWNDQHFSCIHLVVINIVQHLVKSLLHYITHLQRLHPFVVCGVHRNHDGLFLRVLPAAEEQSRAVVGFPQQDHI